MAKCKIRWVRDPDVPRECSEADAAELGAKAGKVASLDEADALRWERRGAVERVDLEAAPDPRTERREKRAAELAGGGTGGGEE